MRFIIVLVTIFSACCCFSVLNISPFETTGRKDNLLLPGKRTLLNYPLADEEIYRFQRSTDKIVKYYKKRPTEEESEDILSEYSQRVQQNSKLLASNDDNDFHRSPPSKRHRSQDHDFNTKRQSKIESSEEVNGKNTGIEKYEATSENPDCDDDLQIMATTTDPQPTAKNSGLWSLLFWNEGTEKPESTSEDPDCDEDLEKMSTTIDPQPTAKSSGIWNLLFLNKEKNEGNSIEKPSDNPEDSKPEFDIVKLSSTNTSSNMRSYFFGARGTADSSNKIRFIENFERGRTAETSTYSENSTDSEHTTTEGPPYNIIWPGTKWCGSGSIAINDDDLGYFEDVDRCCRTHDNCNDIILPGKSKYNLTNTSPFTVLTCECDDQLYECLSQINSFAANAVANIFFNIVGRMCYLLDYPKICKTHTMFGCQEYEINKTAEKVYQWKPAKRYHKMPFVLPG